MAVTLLGQVVGSIRVTEASQTTPLRQVSLNPQTGDADGMTQGTRVIAIGQSNVILWDIDQQSGQGVDTKAHLIHIKAKDAVTKAARSVTVRIRNTSDATISIQATELLYVAAENQDIEAVDVSTQSSGNDTEVEYLIVGE